MLRSRAGTRKQRDEGTDGQSTVVPTSVSKAPVDLSGYCPPACRESAVDPHFTELVNAVELDGELFIVVGIWDEELPAIPTDAGGGR